MPTPVDATCDCSMRQRSRASRFLASCRCQPHASGARACSPCLQEARRGGVPGAGRGRNLVGSSIRTATGRFMSALKFRGIERASGAPVMSEPGSRGADAWIRIELTERRNPHAEASGGSREIFSRGRSGVTVSKKTRSALLSAAWCCRAPRWMARQERKHLQMFSGAAKATSPDLRTVGFRRTAPVFDGRKNEKSRENREDKKVRLVVDT